MEKQEILSIVEHNNNLDVLGYRDIAHPKNPGVTYTAMRVVKMHTDSGEWVDAVVYSDDNTGEGYCRRADDFAKFVEVM